MKLQWLIFSVFLFTLLTAGRSFALRCGTEVVDVGDKTFEVAAKCGDPISKETVGFTLREDRRELEIKEWIYGPWNGVYHYLTFHGTNLVDIEPRRDPN